MAKLNQRGFSAVEVVLVVVLLALVGGVGYYTLQANSKANKEQSAAATKPSSDQASQKQDPIVFVKELIAAMKAKDKVKVDAGATAHLSSTAPTPGTSFYDVCQADAEGCAVFFAEADFSACSWEVAKDEYKAADGTKGKTVNCTIKTGNSDSVTYFNVLPKDNTWQLDDFGFNSDNQATVDSQQ